MRRSNRGEHPEIRDYGGEPFIFNIQHATEMNEKFRIALWTGKDMQLTLMSVPVGEEVGAEMHSDIDQFIRVESGRAAVYMGKNRNDLREIGYVDGGYAILIPAGTWHNVVNVGKSPLKLYSLYAPPEHPFGTVQPTRSDTERSNR